MAIQPPPLPPDPRQGIRPPSVQPVSAPSNSLPAVALGGELAPENEHSFWQHPFVQNVLPFVTSLVLHVSLILMAYLAAQAARKALNAIQNEREDQEKIVKEQVVIPDTEIPPDMSQNSLKGFLGLNMDPTRRAEQDRFPEVPPDSRGTAERPGTNLIPQRGGDGGSADYSAQIGRGAWGGLRPGGGLERDGDGSGRNLAPFGVPGGGGQVSFLNTKGYARRVCYVCDASGSMIDKFDDLRAQINMSVGSLKPTQSFDVILFQDKGCWALDRAGLLAATSDNKAKTEKLLGEVIPRSSTDPIPALELAASLKPELIYVLTDGDFAGPGNEKVIEYCKTRFADGTTKINTIALVSVGEKEHPDDLEFVKTLQAIAKNSGGRFRHVSDEEMSAR